MTVWTKSVLTAIYSLTPLHFGVGQAASAVDLPIAREAGTGFPMLPATGLKGVARDFYGRRGGDKAELSPEVEWLFGPEIDTADARGDLNAGALSFTEARLAAYPVRSLNRPFLHLTCPLIVERLARDLRAIGLASDLVPAAWSPGLGSGQALTASTTLAETPLVLEDLVYTTDEVAVSQPLAELAQGLAELLPEAETATRERLASGLTMIPDRDFADLMARVIPVRARIKLTKGKTTDRWIDPDTGTEEKGSLWYEEYLPPDCLFLAVVAERRQRWQRQQGTNGADRSNPPLATLREHGDHLRVVQIGGNETVGYGLCWWSGW